MKRRIRHDYRQLGNTPAKFLAFCQKVQQSLTNNQNYPDSIWGVHLGILKLYFEKVAILAVAVHVASGGDRNLIRDRDKLIEEIIMMLDQIASLLEVASTDNPDALYTTGYTIAQERRSTNRSRLPLAAPPDFSVTNTGELGQAMGSASVSPGAWNHEIQINRNNPAQEGDWLHKAMYHKAAEMVMGSLEPGNTFFRMRHHGPDGPGPWSSIVSTTIT